MKKMMISFNLPISIFKEGKNYIAFSPVLDLSTSGKNIEETKSRFTEIITLFFEELVKKGTLEEVLTNLGWNKVKKQWEPPQLITQKSERISIPAFA